MKAVNQCFVADGESGFIESFGLASKVVVVATKPAVFNHTQCSQASLTLAQALNQPTAVTRSTLSHEDSIMIHGGVCTLSLTAETFHRAGIEAKLQSGTEKYVAQIKLDGGAAHKRLLWAAENTLTSTFDFDVPGAQTTAATKSDPILTPAFDCPADKEGEQDWANTIQEWAGLVGIGSMLIGENHGVETAISDFHIEGTAEILHITEISGLLLPDEIAKLWEKADLLLVSSSGNWPLAWQKLHAPSDNLTNPCYVLVRGDQSIKSLKFVPWQDL